jgi:hypothetical protein
VPPRRLYGTPAEIERLVSQDPPEASGEGQWNNTAPKMN